MQKPVQVEHKKQHRKIQKPMQQLANTNTRTNTENPNVSVYALRVSFLKVDIKKRFMNKAF